MLFNTLIPELAVSHFDESLSFYVLVLGFQIEYQRPEQQFAFLSYQGNQIMIEQESSTWKTGPFEYPYGRGMNFQMMVDSIDGLLHSLRDHAYPIFVEPEERWYRAHQSLVGQRQFLVLDPDGYALRFAQSLGERR